MTKIVKIKFLKEQHRLFAQDLNLGRATKWKVQKNHVGYENIQIFEWTTASFDLPLEGSA